MADDTNTLPIFRANFELVVAISQLKDHHKESRQLIEAHIERWSNCTRIVSADFEPGLQWFNTTRPLSLTKDLRGKIVVLDFFTYCCVNCQHILPDLQELQRTYSVEDGVVVVGVHSPKFEHEKDPSSLLNAVLRNGISHAVVNDPQCKLWQMLFVNCWPTLLILGPEGQILFIFMGEGHRKSLFGCVKICLELFKSTGRISSHSLPIRSERQVIQSAFLSYPGKICVSPDRSLLAIADSGHHRIVIATNVGLVMDIIGKGEKAFTDGDFTSATFSSPQGICWTRDTLYVADSGNHAIRKIDLIQRTVTTAAGNGQMGSDEEGGAIGSCQGLNTPWDICLVNSAAGTLRDPDVLLIAMSGSHQIWLLALRDGARWYKHEETFPLGVCVRVYGSGQEEHRNNMYAFKAGFAQPSGLAFDDEAMHLYVADSESSSIRQICLLEGSVKNVVGASRDPTDLFTFGDVDGAGGEVRLQHPLGVAFSRRLRRLLVADTYNHKIKIIDTLSRQCRTLIGEKHSGSTAESPDQTKLDEPGGLCLSETENETILFIADTNNNCIKACDLSTNSTIEIPLLYRPELSFKQLISHTPSGTLTVAPITVNLPPIIVGHDQAIAFNLAICGGGMELEETSYKQQWKLKFCLFSEDNALEYVEVKDACGYPITKLSGTLTSLQQEAFLSIKTKSCFPKDVSVFTTSLDVMLAFCDKKRKICVSKHITFLVPCRMFLENSKKECTTSVELCYFLGSV